jgi:hypothetical protein
MDKQSYNRPPPDSLHLNLAATLHISFLAAVGVGTGPFYTGGACLHLAAVSEQRNFGGAVLPTSRGDLSPHSGDGGSLLWWCPHVAMAGGVRVDVYRRQHGSS